MSGLNILFRRREQYVKKMAEVNVAIYYSLTLKEGAQILLDDIIFAENGIKCKLDFGGTGYTALYGVNILENTKYTLARANNGAYKGLSNGSTTSSQVYFSNAGHILTWKQDGIYLDDSATPILSQTRINRNWAFQFSSTSDRKTTFYYLEIYDSTGQTLLHSLKPALLNGTMKGLYDEVNRKFYGMTSDVGELELN